MRRPLAETMLELAGAGGDLEGAGMALRITSVAVDVPIEVRVRQAGDEWEFLADLPQWRWQTGIEELRGRLRFSWGESSIEEALDESPQLPSTTPNRESKSANPKSPFGAEGSP